MNTDPAELLDVPLVGVDAGGSGETGDGAAHEGAPAQHPWTLAQPDTVAELLTDWVSAQGITLYPHQDAALLELVTGANVILATPTGTGKSLVAIAAHAVALAGGQRTYYTAPIKALVNEKFFDLCSVFGPDRVGMLTGDAAVNPEAPLICCTAEVLANQALREGPDAGIGQVVMDEFHYYADPDRGWAWQVPLLELPRAQFLLMSATLGDVSFFRDDLTRRTGRPTAVIDDAPRPVPLDFSYVYTPVHETIENLLEQGKGPVYVVGFTQAEAMQRAQALTSTLRLSPARKDLIAARVAEARLRTAFGKNLSRYLRHGIGVHHAGMLPRYRRFVEQLAQAGLLRFHQIGGRAGRAGFDDHGSVVALAPDHEIANTKALAKAGTDEKKRRKVTRKSPAPGALTWTEKTFDRLRDSPAEPLTSQFAVSHAMVLNVLARPGDPFEAMRHLLRDNHEPRSAQNRHIRAAIAAYRALEAADVAERVELPDGTRRAQLRIDLPDNFALNQALSTFALAALDLLDPASPDYAADVVSVIEATLEDPTPVIRAQRDKARGEAVAQMKADGIEYDERMELLEDIGHPQPLRELLEVAYDAYRRTQPWVLDHELKPKSVVREMLEQGMGFADLVATYGLTRSEGTVLRYLSDAYRALRSGIPGEARTPELDDVVAWLGELVRQTDSSLVQEWEQLTGADTRAGTCEPDPVTPPSVSATGVSANTRAFTVMVRNAMFRLVTLAARERYDDLAQATGWTARRWADTLADYWAEHEDIGTDAHARGGAFFLLDTAPPTDLVHAAFPADTDEPADDAAPRAWWVRQVLADPDGHHDWAISAVVDLQASDETGEPVLRVLQAGET